MEKSTQEKFLSLKENLKNLKKVLIAFSGGVDSTLLLKVAKDTLGTDNVVALTAVSPSLPESEKTDAIKLAKEINVKHILFDTNEMKDENYKRNNSERCYFCKSNLYEICSKEAKGNKIIHILNGLNADDINDFRPGQVAAIENKVLSPLFDAKLTKDEIRVISKDLKLSTWNKSEMACLASRLPYGEEITEEKLKVIEEAEKILKNLNFKEVRVRFHKDTARIEINEKDFEKIIDKNIREEIIKNIKNLGFLFVSLDMEGYKKGSLNRELQKAELN